VSAPLDPITPREARRLALARGGLLPRRWSGLPEGVPGRGGPGQERRARSAAHQIIRRFGYLQLDTVSVAGARSHTLVLLSRLDGLNPDLGEELLKPGEPLFEYWGHEASWMPIELYPAFAFRRQRFAVHPWWGDLLGEHPEVADGILRRIRDEGPLRSADLEGPHPEGAGGGGWWNLKLTKKVANALWSRGDLAIRERRGFQRSYDLAERVIPPEFLGQSLPTVEAVKLLLLRALAGHGWARTGTLTATWRLTHRQEEIRAALAALVEEGAIAPCDLVVGKGKKGRRHLSGWIRPGDRELAARLARLRPRRDRGVLLSPFDPLLWDRSRVADLFAFDQVLEIFKTRTERQFGYYCLPVLAGEHLVARVDLKADRKAGTLSVLALHYEANQPETEEGGGTASAVDRAATESALTRHADALGLALRRGGE